MILKSRIGAVELLKPQPTDELADLMDATIRKWHRRPRLSVFPAPSNPDRCSDKALILLRRTRANATTPAFTPICWRRGSNRNWRRSATARPWCGTSTISAYCPTGWSCAHSIWLTDEDIDLMAKAQGDRGAQPESNSRIGTGLARAPLMHQRGVADRDRHRWS